MIADSALLFGSALLAAAALWLVRGDRFIMYCVLLAHATWHMPVVLMAVMPFDLPIKSPANQPYVLLLLGLFHCIVGAGVAGYVSVRRSRRRPPPVFNLQFGRGMVVAAFIGGACLAIDAFVFRTPLTMNLGANRVAYSNAATSPFGHVGILLGSLALYLLLAKPAGLRTLGRYGGPFLIYAATYLLVGNRQFMFIGIIMLVINYLADKRPPLLKTVVAGSLAALAFLVLMTLFGAARQSQTKGVQDLALSSLMRVEILDYDHPLTSRYAVRTAALYVYLYYGIEYEMAGSIMRNVTARAPLLSLTVPIVYRRFSPYFGLPDQAAVMEGVADEVGAKLGVYPNVWSTMFTQAFYEGGMNGVYLLAAALCITNFLVTRSVVRRRTNGSVAALTIFYACLIFGIMFAPTREGSVAMMLVLVVVMAVLRAVGGASFFSAPGPSKEAPADDAARAAVPQRAGMR